MSPKPGSPEGIILNYINEQNRPLNAQVIADALQNHGIRKATVQKVLDTFSDNGTISFKDFGKQKIYLAKQDQFTVPSSEELEQMTKENARVQNELAAKKASVNELETELRSMATHLTDSQIAERTQKLTDEIATIEAKLSKLREGTVLVTPEEKKSVEESFNLKLGLWRKRKRMFKELWDMMTEAIPENFKQFREELGIETDEEVGIRLEDHCNLAVKKQRCA
ncbi:unnamed protein product [Calypogeia fissa]